MKEYTEEEVRLIIDGAVAQEREACIKFFNDNESEIFFGAQAASALRAKGQALGNMNKEAEQNGGEL
jgi:selenocysteine lyase/cysteine desulfurase